MSINIMREIKTLKDDFQIILNKLTIIECLFENIDTLMKDMIIIKNTLNRMNGYDT